MENGAIAQLGERFNGIEEVVGSIPSGSTILTCKFIGLADRHDAGAPSDSSLSGSLIYQVEPTLIAGQSKREVAEKELGPLQESSLVRFDCRDPRGRATVNCALGGRVGDVRPRPRSDEALAEPRHHKRPIDLEAAVIPTASTLQ